MKPTREMIVSGTDWSLRRRRYSGLDKVPGYRLYSLDRADKVASAEWIEAEDDEAAIEVAKKMMDGHDCELWTRKRMVARIPRVVKD